MRDVSSSFVSDNQRCPEHARATSRSSGPKTLGKRAQPTLSVDWPRRAGHPRTLYVLADQALDAFDQPVHWKRFTDIVIDAEHLSVRFMPAAFVGRNHDHAHRRFAGTAHFLKHQGNRSALASSCREMTRSGFSRSDQGRALDAVASDQHCVAVSLERQSQRFDDSASSSTSKIRLPAFCPLSLAMNFVRILPWKVRWVESRGATSRF